jgi:hypothetical protein
LDYANEQEKINHQLNLKRIVGDDPSLVNDITGQDSLMMDESKVFKEGSNTFRPRKRKSHQKSGSVFI